MSLAEGELPLPETQPMVEAPIPSEGPLKKALQKLFIKNVIRSIPPSEGSLKALIVDRTALRILSAAMNTNELIHEGISVIELIDIRREPLPSVPAIYLLSPSVETMEHLSEESSRQYKSFRVFFTTHVPDYLMDVFKKKARFLSRVKAFTELNVRFLAFESRLFSLDRPAASLPQVHASDNPKQTMREEISSMSDRLAEVCTLLAPKVQWDIRHDAMSFTARTLASLVTEEMGDSLRKRHLKKYESNAESESSDEEDDDHNYLDTENMSTGDTFQREEMKKQSKTKKATLLIVDRASDLISPLVHEYTYQAMAHDVLMLNYRKPGGAHMEIEEDGKKKFLQIDDEDEDPVWNEIRSLFIEDALKKAQVAFNDFIENDAAYKLKRKGTEQLKIQDMSAAVRALPKSQKKADKHALHINATRQCLDHINENNLNELVLLEQDLLSGTYADGTKIKSEVIYEQLINTLLDEQYSLNDKTRLLLIAVIIAQGLPGISGEQSALSTSETFKSKLNNLHINTVLPNLSPEIISTIEGIKRLIHIASEGYSRVLSKTNPNLLGTNAETLTTKLMQTYNNRQIQRRQKKESRIRQQRQGFQIEDEMTYDISRYNPPLRSVMMDLVDDELDEMTFPHNGEFSVDSIIASLGVSSLNPTNLDDDVQSDRSQPNSSSSHATSSSKEWSMGRFKLHRKSKTSNRNSGLSRLKEKLSHSSDNSSATGGEEHMIDKMADPSHLYVVFVVGGVAYSEVRAMREVCAKRGANVIIGGSDVLTPMRFMKQLAAVADPVIRLQIMIPPSPLELGVIRAPKDRKKPLDSFTPSVTPGDDAAQKDPEEMDEEFHKERQNVDVVVVTPYKKRGVRFFRKR